MSAKFSHTARNHIRNAVSRMFNDHEFRKSIRDDIAHYLTGWPIGTLKSGWKWLESSRFPWLNSSYYLKDDYQTLLEIYTEEVKDLIRFPFPDSAEKLLQIVELDHTSSNTPPMDVYIRRNRSTYTLEPEVFGTTESAFRHYVWHLKLRRRFFQGNNFNLRLVAIKHQKSRIELLVTVVKYEDYARTNLCLDALDSPQSTTLRRRLHQNGTLDDLVNSKLGNSLGVNALLFTADGKLIIQKRSRKVAELPNQLGPSYSGVTNMDDAPAGSAIPLVEFSIFREGREELGFSPDAIAHESVRFLGVTRELVRGGKPELFFVSRLNLTRNEILKNWSSAWDKFESKKIIFHDFGDLPSSTPHTPGDQHRFRSAVEKLIMQGPDVMSLALKTNIALWTKHRCSIDVAGHY
jgi:hypothetical protein